MKSEKPPRNIEAQPAVTRTDAFAEEHPYPVLQLNAEGRVLYANPASLPVLLEWEVEVGGILKSDLFAPAKQAFAEGIATKKDVQHGQTMLELVFSRSLMGEAINIFGQDVTTQRILQQELLESRKSAIQARDDAQEVRKSLEKAEIIGKYGSWEFDVTTNQAKWSNGLYEIFGYEAESVSPSLDAFFSLLSPTDQESIRATLNAALANPSKEIQIEYTITRRDKTIRRIRGVGQVIVDAKGAPAKLIGTTQDVTDLAVALEEAQFYKNALDQAAIVAITDRVGTITHVNENFCRISGYERQELLGQTHRLVNSGVMEREFFQSMWKTISSGSLWKGEICNRSKDGRYYWVDTAIIPFMDTQGKPERYVAIRADVTLRKKAEEELIRTKELALSAYRRLEEAEKVGRFGSWEWNLKDRSFHCSKGLYTIFQWSDDLVPTYELFMSFLMLDDRKTLEPALEAALMSKQPFSCNYRIKLKNDEVRWIRSEGHAIFDAAGKPIKLLGTAQDVTEKMQNEMELTEATLRADSATRTKAEFLANMSHEIRTPMNGVIGMCNLLLGSVSDGTQLEQLKIIQNCGNSLLNIINDILDFSKLEAGKIELEKEPFNIHQTAQEIVQLLSAKALEKRILLSYAPDESAASWFLGDTTRFRQILTNLVSNAIKFTEKGTVTITSSGRRLEGGQSEIQFSVRDTGIGIPESAKQKLFSSFSQADVSTTRKYGGTGLGLAISRGLCEKMGGKIWFESEPGKGSVFSFTMVLSETLAAPNFQSSNPSSTIDSEMGRIHPLEILIAEDNRVNQLVAVGFLEKLGYRPDVAANGLEVLDNLNRKQYHIIFMDFHMPEMDGIEATKRICEKYPEVSRPYIVALTASAMKEDVDRCLSAGMKDFISKPLQIKEVSRVLKEMIKQSAPKPLEKKNEEEKLMKNELKAALDWKACLTNFEGLEDVLIETIDSFLNLHASLIGDIQASIQKMDAKSLEISAHTLKGAVSNFCAEPSRLLAWDLERLGNSGKIDGADQILQVLKSEVERLCEALEELKPIKEAS